MLLLGNEKNEFLKYVLLSSGRPQIYTFFNLKFVIFISKYMYNRDFFALISRQQFLFVLVMNFKMLTIVGILKFMT